VVDQVPEPIENLSILRISPVWGVLALIGAFAAPAFAAPAADLVVVWAPGTKIAPVEAIARRHGAAVIDKSPLPPTATQTAQQIQQGIDAYSNMHYEDAAKLLASAASEVERNGAAGVTTAQLSDLFLFRGLVKDLKDDPSGAFDDLVIAGVVDPTRELDPLRFPPKVVEQFERAKETIRKREHGQLTVEAPVGCTTLIDGAPASGPVDRLAGLHWVRVICADREPYGHKIELIAGATTLPVQPTPYMPPSDSELLIQARTASARAVVIAEVHGQVATARLIGLDGRERDRRTVTLTSDLVPLAAAVGDLLAPPPEHHWYDSKWAWAGGAAILAAAVLIPVTAAIAGSSAPSSATFQPMWPAGGPWQR
jgi:hypothetical protein